MRGAQEAGGTGIGTGGPERRRTTSRSHPGAAAATRNDAAPETRATGRPTAAAAGPAQRSNAHTSPVDGRSKASRGSDVHHHRPMTVTSPGRPTRYRPSTVVRIPPGRPTGPHPASTAGQDRGAGTPPPLSTTAARPMTTAAAAPAAPATQAQGRERGWDRGWGRSPSPWWGAEATPAEVVGVVVVGSCWVVAAGADELGDRGAGRRASGTW